ncbi:MAG: hypothetical protein CMF22_11240 [Idiomarinaceae bacterium]|nr:hypothetical protein [Idiomarinaceae bacterium]|tara:strand:+ start:139531 stop:141075 length:1545 start_codon:yes stop_codon:yes gene_type:complete
MNKPYEHKWKPVRVAGGSGSGSNKDTGYSISTTSVSSNWYNKQIDVSGNRKTRLQRYYTMDRTSVEISRSLDILAEDISSANADSEEIFNLQYDENTKYPRTVIALLEQMKDLWSERSRMHDEAFSRVRNTLKYGMTIYTREADGNLKYIRPERIVGHILDEHDDTKVTHYIVDPSAPLMQSEDSKRSTFDPARNHDQSTEKKHRVYAVEDLVVLRIGDGPYGESVLDTVFTVWKQMTLIEDAIVIYRVVHAPERRIYYIDTGNLQGPKREQAIERQRLKLMQKQVNRNNQMTSDYDPHSTSESIFIPTNSMGKGSRVETLQGGTNLGELSDLEYFTKKMAAGLRIPSSMIDTQTDQQNQFSDMRVGQVYQVEMRYMGHIKRISRIFARELNKDFIKFCEDREVEVPKTVKLVFNDPSSYAKYKEIEVQQQLLNLASATTQFPSLSKRFVLEKFMMMDEEEIIKNEEEKLREKGLDSKTIKSMPREHIDNLVYGDGSVGDKYGIKPPEGQGGFY